jgi:hypothetical protein
VIRTSVTEILSTSGLTIILLAVGLYLARTWAASKIQEAVKADYQIVVEGLKEELRRESARRERAAAIADFLATWVAPTFDPEKRNDVALLEVQRKYWELALWLDASTLRELNEALSGEGGYHVTALVRVRESLLGEEARTIDANELINWRAGQSWSDWSTKRHSHVEMPGAAQDQPSS